MTNRPTLMSALRAEMATFAILCAMVLAIPLVQPIARAHAVENGLDIVICTQAGIVPDPGSGLPDTMPQDCPCVVSCSMFAAGKLLKALHTGSAETLPQLHLGSGWLLASPSRSLGDDAPADAYDIRGPPLPV
ncbi:hypothetical protein [Hoeflea sp. TYP-13]|uniref:hypothetical protein n=1 Tax=Hoeflea sp. TYP-13 TaxID=3230023 RepID=UPI0034C63617